MIATGQGQRRVKGRREEKGVHAAWNHQWTHLLCSAFKRKGGGKNGIPGGLMGQIQTEGMVSNVAIAALFCFHSSEKFPDAPPEGAPGMNRETEKGHKWCKIEFPQRNSRSLIVLPPFLMPPQVQDSHDAALWSTQAHPEVPSPWLHLFSTEVEGSICDTQAPESPVEFRDSFVSHPWPTLRSQPGQHPGQLQVSPQPCHIPHQRDPSSQSADTASLSHHARPSYLRLGRKDSWTHTFLPLNMLTFTNYLCKNHLVVIWSSHSQALWLHLTPSPSISGPLTD